MSKARMSYEAAVKGAFLAGGLGSRCRGYIDGWLGREPNGSTESSLGDYEDGWLQGAEHRQRRPDYLNPDGCKLCSEDGCDHDRREQ